MYFFFFVQILSELLVSGISNFNEISNKKLKLNKKINFLIYQRYKIYNICVKFKTKIIINLLKISSPREKLVRGPCKASLLPLSFQPSELWSPTFGTMFHNSLLTYPCNRNLFTAHRTPVASPYFIQPHHILLITTLYHTKFSFRLLQNNYKIYNRR